jgi:DNA adenine methylase
MLRRPARHFKTKRLRRETLNDKFHLIANFWRAITAEPDIVARWADYPVSEIDLHCRHQWLVRSPEALALRERMAVDPDAYDAKIAGWWVWGACLWIGGGGCIGGSGCGGLGDPC